MSLLVTVSEHHINVKILYKLFKVYGSIYHIRKVGINTYIIKYMDRKAAVEAFENLSGSITSDDFVICIEHHKL
jgi:hypothetical protein